VGDALAAAISNNVAWCTIVCTAHGLEPRDDGELWSVRTRAPRFYPDAITRSRSVAAERVIGAIDATSGSSVKDSFAALDLSPHGFDVLFEASWFVRQPGASPLVTEADVRWDVVADDAQLRAWERAWADGHDDGLFTRAILESPDVTFLGASRGDAIVGGAIANLGPGEVVGLSNTFATDEADDAVWSGALRALERRWPTRAVVGYERDDNLARLRRLGATSLGPLGVWSKP
jgi:hypothetical protein